MYEQVVIAALTVAGAYVLLGLAFALAFTTVGVTRVDHEARDSSWAFRLLIVPGVTAFWPLLLRRWIHATGEAPVQRDPHR